jgi:hypothetical protein
MAAIVCCLGGLLGSVAAMSTALMGANWLVCVECYLMVTFGSALIVLVVGCISLNKVLPEGQGQSKILERG